MGSVTFEPIVDLDDAEARRALVLKWGAVDPDVLPAWVAEMDYEIAPPVAAAVAASVAAGRLGYPDSADRAVAHACAGFMGRHFGWQVADEQVSVWGTTLGAARAVLLHWAEPGPVVLHTPAYHPFLELVPLVGRELVRLDLPPDREHATIDLDELDRAFAAGARTLLLCNPHNPWGRAFTRTELEGVRDVVVAHGARVVVDEIHAPLVLPGATCTPYLSLPGTAAHAVTLTSATKSFNLAGLPCAQVVAQEQEYVDLLGEVTFLEKLGLTPLGMVAAEAAFAYGDPWLASLVERLDEQRALLTRLLATHLPEARMRPLEATYLAWLDLRGYGHDDPAAVALERGRVRLAPGHDFSPGLTGHARLNIATSPERLARIVERLAGAL